MMMATETGGSIKSDGKILRHEVQHKENKSNVNFKKRIDILIDGKNLDQVGQVHTIRDIWGTFFSNLKLFYTINIHFKKIFR